MLAWLAWARSYFLRKHNSQTMGYRQMILIPVYWSQVEKKNGNNVSIWAIKLFPFKCIWRTLVFLCSILSWYKFFVSRTGIHDWFPCFLLICSDGIIIVQGVRPKMTRVLAIHSQIPGQPWSSVGDLGPGPQLNLQYLCDDAKGKYHI